jgi:hypothetical protein
VNGLLDDQLEVTYLGPLIIRLRERAAGLLRQGFRGQRTVYQSRSRGASMIIRTFPVTSVGPSCSSERILGPGSFASKLKLHNCLSTDSSEKTHGVCHLTVVDPFTFFVVAVSCVPSSLSHKPAKMWGNYLAIMILVAGPNNPCRASGCWSVAGTYPQCKLWSTQRTRLSKGRLARSSAARASQEQFSSGNTTPTA